MERTRNDMADRISALPEPILHHILSFLPMEEVVRTVILSKRWKEVWHAFPILKLYGAENSFSKNYMILRFFERTLRSRHAEMISLRKFVLKIERLNNPSCLSVIDRCLFYAIASNVQSLKLSFGDELYNLPQYIFGARSVGVLELSGCKLERPRIDVTLSSLRKLNLCNVRADDHVFENLVAGCPSIECLYINFCVGLKSLELPNLRNLKQIVVTNNRELGRLKIEGLDVNEITLFALSRSCQIDISPCRNIRDLKLWQLCITDEWLCNEISKFPQLEFLSIMQCYKLETIDISSPCLKTFCIIDCFKLVEVKIDTPNLGVFRYGGDLISFSLNGLALAKADLDIDSRNIDAQWFVRYIEFLSEMHRFCKAFNLRSQTGKNVIIPSEVRQIIHPPLSGVRHLNFKMHDHKYFPLSDIVDGLMWISPHVESISIEYEDAYWDKSYIEFAYNKELIYEGEGQIPLCCQSVPVSCWQHCIKEVKLGHARISGGRTIVVERYFIEGKEILEKFNDLCSNLMDEYCSGDDMFDGSQNSDDSDLVVFN